MWYCTAVGCIDRLNRFLPTASPPVPVPVVPRPPSLWNEDLDSRWAEVDFLLRRPLQTEEDILYTVAATEAGIPYISFPSLDFRKNPDLTT